MSEVVDIVTRLTYEVIGDNAIVQTTKKIEQQAEAIAKAESKIKEFQGQLDIEKNIKTRDQLTRSIEKQTDRINKLSTSIKQQIADSKPVQIAIQRELGLIEQLTDRINDLRQARERQTSKSGITEINKEIEATKNQLNELIGISKVAEKQGGGILASLFGIGSAGGAGKQVLQGVLGGLGIGVGFSVLPALIGSLTELAIKEFDVTKKTEDLLAANKALASSFEAVSQEVTALNEQERILIENRIRATTGLDITAQGYKAAEEAAKAYGVINGEIFKTEQEQFNLAQQRRQLEQNRLEEAYKNAVRFQAILEQAKAAASKATAGGLGTEGDLRRAQKNAALGVTNASLLPTEQKQELSVALETARKNNANILDVLDKQRREANIKTLSAERELELKTAEQRNAANDRKSKLDAQVFDKNKALQQQIAAEEENYRQLKEKQDIQSVDKIVKDTQAKYKQLLKNIERDEIETRDKVGIAAFNQKDKDGNSLAGDFAALRGINKRSQTQEQNNLTEAFLKQSSLTALQNAAKSSATNADISRTAVALGLPDYDALIKLLDDETKAKADAIRLDAVNTKNALIANGQDITELQEQERKKIEQNEEQAYKNRLSLATEYYQQLAQIISTQSNILATQAATRAANQRTGIITGGGGNTAIDRGLQRANIQAQREQNVLSIQENGKLLIDAQAQLDKLQIEAQQATSAEKTRIASEAAAKQLQIVEDLNRKIAEATESNAKGEREDRKIRGQQLADQIGVFASFVKTVIDGYNTIADARQRDLDREISVREQRITQANELAKRGNTEALAIEQKALDKANQERRKAAQQQQAINSALVISNSLVAIAQAAATGAGALVLIPLIVSAIGAGFASVYALNESSKQGFRDGVVGLQGPGGETSDSIPANLSRGESVITASATRRHRDALILMNKGIDPFPMLARPEYINANNSTFASRSEVRELGGKLDAVVSAIEGKSVNVSQNVDKSGVHQMVIEQSKQNALKWKH